LVSVDASLKLVFVVWVEELDVRKFIGFGWNKLDGLKSSKLTEDGFDFVLLPRHGNIFNI